MIRALAPCLLAIAACGRSSGVSDEQLGNLVVEPKRADTKIDVARAATEPAELGRALTRPYEKLLADFGPHAITIKTQTVVDEAGKPVSELPTRRRSRTASAARIAACTRTARTTVAR